jgi:hypothetical protein
MEMLKSKKSQVTCSYCSKIYKDPIVLPCGDSICREHLSDKDVLKVNRIKCKKCNEEFGVKNNEFKSNEDLRKLTESQSYFSEDEIVLKQELEESIQKFFEFYDKFAQKKTQLDSDVYNYFHELRFQVDEHRERLKEKIDDIVLAMIDRIKKHEEAYLKNLNENTLVFDYSKSLVDELAGVEETFRNPNLLIQSIKEMQQRQEVTLKDIQLKLNEIKEVNYHLKATNEFMPNSSLFDQNETSTLFGSIKLEEYSNTNSFKGEILTDFKQSIELINLCEFSPNDEWTLLYRATRNGFSSDVFHSKCDGHSNTLTILKAKESQFVFGGFTTVSWDSFSGDNSDPNAFIFSLTNKDNTPLKMKVDPDEHESAICCHSRYGPIFGGYDIIIYNNANTTMDGYSNLGYSYKHPQYARGTNEAKTFLAGSTHFHLDEIEVYQK